MTPERPLAEIELTSWRRVARQSAVILVAIVAAVTGFAAMMSVPATGVSVVLMAAAVALAITAARTLGRRYPRGVWVGWASVGTGAVGLALMAVALVGLVPVTVEITMLGALALSLLGQVLISVEVLTHRAERARLRRDVDPVFPAARVVER